MVDVAASFRRHGGEGNDVATVVELDVDLGADGDSVEVVVLGFEGQGEGRLARDTTVRAQVVNLDEG